ncbi:metabolite traffic protein EboE [Catenovulum agarivorans]|uniref:metabolite traffic protein EboE n=1 Tax=Catenovulum agarivorans TaxID=1172192 RepID=UPI0002E5CA0F|nr:metabolite traffic protein EboE [Catenovulum agarivorans]
MSLTQANWLNSDLAYCSNVHPGETAAQVQNNIENYISQVREQLGWPVISSGLWLSAKAADELVAHPQQLAEFKTVLATQKIRLTSLNGFPFGDFHQAVVKQSVYQPTWASEQRLDYTYKLACILAECLPETEQVGAISTLPLAYKAEWNDGLNYLAMQNLLRLVCMLQKLEQQTGKCIQIGLEMEPDCVFEKTSELVGFFTEQLLPLAKLQNIAAGTVLRYLGCCYDTCHQAVLFEDIQYSLTQITQAGIQLVKVQISNAISADLSVEGMAEKLTSIFADKKFLHQCKVKQADGGLSVINDLSLAALKQAQADHLNTAAKLECRIHYHVPIHLQKIALSADIEIATTQQAIIATLNFLQTNPQLKPKLEVETYTWLNFVEDKTLSSGDLIVGLTQELEFLQQQMQRLGLLK